MKKVVFTMIIVATIALAFGTVGVAYAKSPNQGSGVANGWMGGNGSRSGMGVGYTINGDEILHDSLLAGYSEALDISVIDIETRLDSGETMAQIALSAGLTFEEFNALKLEVRSQAIDQAFNDGLLTQTQADWMKQIGARQMAGGFGGYGMYATGQAGQGLYLNPSCPYYSPTNP
jgi:hypothetical protein